MSLPRKPLPPRFPGEIRRVVRCRVKGCLVHAELGPLCAKHAHRKGLVLKPSRFGGLGLFASEGDDDGNRDRPTFRAGEAIAEYGGRLLLRQKTADAQNFGQGTYCMDFGEDRVLDGCDSTSSFARFANDGTFEGLNNAEFSHYTAHPSRLVLDAKGFLPIDTPDSVWLEASRDIYPGEEILASYGSAYWDE